MPDKKSYSKKSTDRPTTMATGEESGGGPTTMATGEEDVTAPTTMASPTVPLGACGPPASRCPNASAQHCPRGHVRRRKLSVARPLHDGAERQHRSSSRHSLARWLLNLGAGGR